MVWVRREPPPIPERARCLSRSDAFASSHTRISSLPLAFCSVNFSYNYNTFVLFLCNASIHFGLPHPHFCGGGTVLSSDTTSHFIGNSSCDRVTTGSNVVVGTPVAIW